MEYTQYITRRRARFNGYGGRRVNIPYGTKLAAAGGDILFEGVPLCCVTSENARQYFSQNDDGQGEERGKLVGAITSQMEKRDAGHQARWDRLWDDQVANKYRNPGFSDHWLWGQAFYDAPVDDLRHIAALVAKGPRRCEA